MAKTEATPDPWDLQLALIRARRVDWLAALATGEGSLSAAAHPRLSLPFDAASATATDEDSSLVAVDVITGVQPWPAAQQPLDPLIRSTPAPRREGAAEATAASTTPGYLATPSAPRALPLVVDSTAPGVIGFSPADGSSSVPTYVTIVLNFSEPIQRGTGLIQIRSGSATGTLIESFDAALSSRLATSGSKLSIDPTRNLPGGTRFYVVLPAGSIKDLAGNNYAGTSSYDFKTAAADTSAPFVSSLTPADGASNVAVGTTITVNFNETIQRGSGLIQLRSGSASGSVVESFDAASSSRLSLSSKSLSIDPSNDLAANTRYYVTFAAGTIQDLSGNPFAGTSSYDFLTADTAPPQVVSYTPADAATGVWIGSNLVLTFNETIKRGSGWIELRSGSPTGTLVESFATASSSRLSLSGSTLSLDPSSYLLPNSVYYLTLSAGSILDLAGNPCPASSDYDITTGSIALAKDPLYGQQWHLKNTGQGGGMLGIDANVEAAWNQTDSSGQVLGNNVTIAIVDDGLQWSHPDLRGNYLAAGSYDFNYNDSDPSPGSADSHGTACAGVAAADGINGVGVSGAAPLAELSGVRLIAAAATDATEAKALNYLPNINEIYSNSWGPADSGNLLGAIGPQAKAALANGVATGRNGKGSIYTWAGGNGAQSGDNSNYDGYANSIYVIAVGAIANTGYRASYSEPGANLLVCAPSSGGSLGIVTTDLVGSSGYNGLTDTSYTNKFGGTSSATPLVSAVIALMLDANPTLSWRDVMHVLVRSARKVDTASAGWQVNGAGLSYNHQYGFGMVDAGAAVSLAKTWTNVAPQAASINASQTVNQAIPDAQAGSVVSKIAINENVKIESVEVRFNATHSYRGDLQIVLTSPSGSSSILATKHSDSNANYANWTFSSRKHWDESSQGTWSLTVTDMSVADTGALLDWGLTIRGTPLPAATLQTSSPSADAATPTASSTDPGVALREASLLQQIGTTGKSTQAKATTNPNPGRRVADLDRSHSRDAALQAYVAYLNQLVRDGQADPNSADWTVMTDQAGPGGLDAVTGLRSLSALAANDSPTALAPVGAGSASTGQVFRVRFEPGRSAEEISAMLSQKLGQGIGFFYPNLEIQQMPKAWLPASPGVAQPFSTDPSPADPTAAWVGAALI